MRRWILLSAAHEFSQKGERKLEAQSASDCARPAVVSVGDAQALPFRNATVTDLVSVTVDRPDIVLMSLARYGKPFASSSLYRSRISIKLERWHVLFNLSNPVSCPLLVYEGSYDSAAQTAVNAHSVSEWVQKRSTYDAGAFGALPLPSIIFVTLRVTNTAALATTDSNLVTGLQRSIPYNRITKLQRNQTGLPYRSV